jgi:hypothetical protein
LNTRTKEGEHGALEIHDEKYSGKAWTVKVREVLENLEQVRKTTIYFDRLETVRFYGFSLVREKWSTQGEVI